MSLPRIGITMGDPAGIGPEVVLKALARAQAHACCRPLVIGDARWLQATGALLGLPLAVRRIGHPREAKSEPGTVDVIDLALVAPDTARGRACAAAGEAAFRFIERAVALAREGALDAIATAPISKQALNAAGHRYPGHTELLAELTGTDEVSLALLSPRLRVIHVTAHIGLADAIARIDAGLVLRTIERGRDLVLRLLRREPRIGVCGINPHAGEGGLFGRGEEEAKIAPAVAAARARGWTVAGPLAADSLFHLAVRGDYDLVVAMYHDQGHAPVKALGIEHGVNVTAGLPIVRTSADHGTAFDIAASGRADERSMLEAIRQAAALASRR